MRIALIAALSRERVIGKDGALPWRLSADLKRFKALTLGHPVIMGRKTFESIGRPLPGRTNVVVTRNRSFAAAGCVVAHSVADAIERARQSPGADEAFVIGGEEVFREALPLAQRMFLTEVDGAYAGDAFFPEFDRGEWRERGREPHPAGDGAPAHVYVDLERIRDPRHGV